MPSSYLDRAKRYLSDQGWAISTTQVRDGTFIISGKRAEGTRSLTMVITEEENSVTQDHLKYLLKTARKHDVEQCQITSEKEISSDIQSAIDRHDIDIIDNEQIVGSTIEFDTDSDDISFSDVDSEAATAGDDSGTKRSVITRRRVLLVGGILIGGLVLSGGDGDTNTGSSDDNTAGTADPDLETVKNQAETVEYDPLLRNSDQYKGEYIHFPKAKIIQVLGDADQGFQFRTNVTESEYVWEDDILVRWDGERFVTDDIVEIWGRSRGLVTYETALGSNRTIPDLKAYEISLVEE